MNKLCKKSLMSLFVAILVMVPLAAFSATGCEEDADNEYVNPELALCSVHVYNIGGAQNPSNDAQREIMKDVVALKTTVITQQMYKQYEYLESIVKRLKIQLEKAVLTTKLQAAGAGANDDSSSGSVSIKNNNSYAVVDNAKDCNMESGTEAVLQCVLDNITLALNAVDDNKNTEARRQLQKDIEIADRWGKSYGFNSKSLTSCNQMSGSQGVRKCAYELRPAVTAAIEKYQKDNRAPQFNTYK